MGWRQRAVWIPGSLGCINAWKVWCVHKATVQGYIAVLKHGYGGTVRVMSTTKSEDLRKTESIRVVKFNLGGGNWIHIKSRQGLYLVKNVERTIFIFLQNVLDQMGLVGGEGSTLSRQMTLSQIGTPSGFIFPWREELEGDGGCFA